MWSDPAWSDPAWSADVRSTSHHHLHFAHTARHNNGGGGGFAFTFAFAGFGAFRCAAHDKGGGRRLILFVFGVVYLVPAQRNKKKIKIKVNATSWCTTWISYRQNTCRFCNVVLFYRFKFVVLQQPQGFDLMSAKIRVEAVCPAAALPVRAIQDMDRN